MNHFEMSLTKKTTRSPAEELHHISEQLDELIQLVSFRTPEEQETMNEVLQPVENEVMTVKEAAEMLRISRPKMYELTRSGKIHSIEVGKKILVSRSSLIAFIHGGE